MTESYVNLTLGGDQRNAEALGVLVAWLITNNLLSDSLDRRAATAVARVKMQDLTGAEFLTTVLDGQLGPASLNTAGQEFCEVYVKSGQFFEDYNGIDYSGEDEWHRYDLMSPTMTAAYRDHQRPENPVRKLAAKIIQFPGRRRD